MPRPPEQLGKRGSPLSWSPHMFSVVFVTAEETLGVIVTIEDLDSTTLYFVSFAILRRRTLLNLQYNRMYLFQLSFCQGPIRFRNNETTFSCYCNRQTNSLNNTPLVTTRIFCDVYVYCPALVGSGLAIKLISRALSHCWVGPLLSVKPMNEKRATAAIIDYGLVRPAGWSSP